MKILTEFYLYQIAAFDSHLRVLFAKKICRLLINKISGNTVKAATLIANLFFWAQVGSCLAQSLLPDPNIELQRQEQQRQQLRQRNEPSPEVRIQSNLERVAARLPDETPCVAIRAVHVTGMDLPSLDAVLSGPTLDDAPENRCIGAQSVRVLIDRVQNALVDHGYITSRVQALPQDLNSGELTLTIEPGYIDKIRQVNLETSMPSAFTALATKSGSVLNLRDIEQTLENLRRNPSAEADIQIIPSEIPGYSDILLSYEQHHPFHLSLAVDDSGSRATGKVQGNATISWDNPLGLGDLVYLSVGRDLADREFGSRGSKNHVVHYSVPVGYWAFNGTSSRNQYHQTVLGAFQSYRYSGESSSNELQASYVAHRSASSKTSVSIKAFARRSNNFIDDTEVEVQRRQTSGWEVGVLHTYYVGSSTLDSQINYRRGTGAFGAISAPEETFGEGTSRMQITQASLSLVTPFEFEALRLQYNSQLRIQWNHTPLTPQDRFCIGGRYTVRGFDGTQSLCGEQGQLWRNEISAPLDSHPLQVYGGIDLGHVGGESTAQLIDKKLVGMVFGLRGLWQVWTGRSLQFDVFVGTPLNKPSNVETLGMTTGFQLSTNF